MADKKRKVAASTAERPVKKPKKALKDVEVTSSDVLDGGSQPEEVEKKRPSRKRAVDFLEEDKIDAKSIPSTTSQADVPKKRSRGTPNGSSTISATEPKTKDGRKAAAVPKAIADTSVTKADDSDSEIEIATEAPSQAPQTVDSEDEDEDVDQGAALLAGFDSDTEDPAQDKDLDLSKTGGIPNYKKTTKKLREAAKKGSEGPGTVYIGRIPHGFYEKQMREYFTQFGDIKRLRLSRNRRTGASKHFAFIEFASDEVAKIVAETMDNYLMFGHILKCKYAPAENLHPDVWKGADKKYRKIPHQKLERQKLDAPKTVEQWAKKNQREQTRREKQAAKLKEVGYEFVSPQLRDPYAAIEEKKKRIAQEEQKSVADGEVVKAIEAPKTEENAVAQPEPTQTSKKEKKSKKTKPDMTNVSPLTEDNLGTQNSDFAIARGEDEDENKEKPSIPPSTAPVPLSNPTTSEDTSKKSKKASGKSSVSAKTSAASAASTDKGEYDNLSSIPLGADAIEDAVPSKRSLLAGKSKSEAKDALSGGASRELLTVVGIADAELKQRKKDRKTSRTREEGRKRSGQGVGALAPAAVAAEEEEKNKERGHGKKLKGILKK